MRVLRLAAACAALVGFGVAGRVLSGGEEDYESAHRQEQTRLVALNPLLDLNVAGDVAVDFVRTAFSREANLLKDPTLLESFALSGEAEKLVLGTGSDAIGRPRLFVVRLRHEDEGWKVVDASNLCVPNGPYGVSYRTSESPVLLGVGVEQEVQLAVEDGQTVSVPPSGSSASIVPLSHAPEFAHVFPIGEQSERNYAACSLVDVHAEAHGSARPDDEHVDEHGTNVFEHETGE